jgi:hypothetical protein
MSDKTFLVRFGPLRVLIEGASSPAEALDAVNRLTGQVAELSAGEVFRERLGGTQHIMLPTTPIETPDA